MQFQTNPTNVGRRTVTVALQDGNDDPSYHVYKIRTGDSADNNPDYASWPAA